MSVCGVKWSWNYASVCGGVGHVDGGGDSTDRNTELAILEVLRDKFPGHLVLGEEGGVSGDATSEYLWCIDPLGNN